MALLGPSGCGKSTLLLMIAGLLAGIGGRDPPRRPAGRRPADRHRHRLPEPRPGRLARRARQRAAADRPARPAARGLSRARPRAPALGRPRGLRQPPALRALGRHAAAHRLLPRPGPRPAAGPDGRAPGCARRHDPRAAAHRPRAPVAADRQDRAPGHPQHRGGGAARRQGGGDLAAARAGSCARSTIDLPRPRDLEVCETTAFHAHVAEIKRIFASYGVI